MRPRTRRPALEDGPHMSGACSAGRCLQRRHVFVTARYCYTGRRRSHETWSHRVRYRWVDRRAGGGSARQTYGGDVLTTCVQYELSRLARSRAADMVLTAPPPRTRRWTHCARTDMRLDRHTHARAAPERPLPAAHIHAASIRTAGAAGPCRRRARWSDGSDAASGRSPFNESRSVW